MFQLGRLGYTWPGSRISALDRLLAMVSRMTKDLFYKALFRAGIRKRTKAGLIHHRRYRTRLDAIRDLQEYIEIFYNRQRRQTRLGVLSQPLIKNIFSGNNWLPEYKEIVSTLDDRPHLLGYEPPFHLTAMLFHVAYPSVLLEGAVDFC
ncbi:hypothetical protein ACFL6N_05570 [Thermodesulfobacteriota bacterium]